MSDNNSIIEITNMMKSNNSDLSEEIRNSIQKVFREKYIDKINGAVKAQYETIKARPTKEIRFLSVMKEFMHEKNHADIDKMINMYTMLNTFNDLKTNVKATYVRSENFNEGDISACSFNGSKDSIHEDGIYDIDTSCLVQKEGMKADLMSTMMMMIFMNNGQGI